MSHSWILDVLADLDAYARKNELPMLAARLTDARHTAIVEIAASSGARGLVCIEGGSAEGPVALHEGCLDGPAEGRVRGAF